MSTAAHLLSRRTGFAAAIFCLALSGCASGTWGFPYKSAVQQGNWITSEQVAMLRPGMTRDQVRFALGSPTLASVLHADRWDYPYFFKPGYGSPTERKFTVYFQNDHLVRWEGDPQPALQPFQIATVKPRSSGQDNKGTHASQTPQSDTGSQNNQIVPRLDFSNANDNALSNIPGSALSGGSQSLR